MDTVLCEDVTVTMGKLSVRVPLSCFRGSSQDEVGTSGPRSRDEETEKQPKVRLAPWKSP